MSACPSQSKYGKGEGRKEALCLLVLVQLSILRWAEDSLLPRTVELSGAYISLSKPAEAGGAPFLNTFHSAITVFKKENCCHKNKWWRIF